MRARTFFTTLATGGAAALLLVGAALAAGGATLPEKATGFDNNHTSHGFIKVNPIVLLVTSANGKAIHQWAPAVGGQDTALDAGSSVRFTCPKDMPLQGFSQASAGVTFPGVKLKLSHGKYGFSVKWTTKPYANYWFSTSKEPKLKLTMTGTVTSKTVIAGTLKIVGGGCTTKKALKYKAHADKTYSVTPGT